MIPIGDEPRARVFPIVTYAIIFINVVVFIIELSVGLGNEAFFRRFAFIPAELDQGADEWLTIFSSMFMHAGPMHIIGNMLYLWIFGDNVEDALGSVQYAFFYIAGGVAAALTHMIIADPISAQIPTVGASGAIAAVLGAYLVLYPTSNVQTLVPFGFFFYVATLPAIFVLGFWFLLQLVEGIATLGVPHAAGGVAFWAHIGGFVYGVLVASTVAHPRDDYGGGVWRFDD